jgi:hypothetical protein
MSLKGFVSTLPNGATVALTFFLFTLWKWHPQACAVNVKHHTVVATRNAVVFYLAVL